MPAHSDAVGYLTDLAKEINEEWFTLVCDAAVSGLSLPDDQLLGQLIALFTKRASYTNIKSVNPAPAASSTPADRLEELSHFRNFKLLGDSLRLSFTKSITLIFGTNGSGKSSVCECLKVLASPEPPTRPLENVRAAGAATPEFAYKFKSDATNQVWTPAIGYGPRRSTVKFFDAAIAARNVRHAVEPRRVIRLAPFKLHLFEAARILTSKLRESLQSAQSENALRLTQALEKIRTRFEKFQARPLQVLDEATAPSILPSQIALGEAFTDQDLLSEKQTAAAELEKASSDEGLRLLRAEHRELEAFLLSLNTLVASAAKLWMIAPAKKIALLREKRTAQEALAQALIPPTGSLDGLLALLRAASLICKLDEASGHACPLCKRDLDLTEISLFKQYHALLSGDLERDIAALKVEITEAQELGRVVARFDPSGWNKFATLDPEIVNEANAGAARIIPSCDATKEPTSDAKESLESLAIAATRWAALLELKQKAIDAASKGRDELIARLAALRAEIEPLEYAQVTSALLDDLKGVQRITVEAVFWNSALPNFTSLLRRITDTAKHAHEELVVFDFEKRLNSEYKTLTEKDMAAFGVTLFRRGTEAAVTVVPQIGGNEIERVLSEGEQRIHALALFFAELETCRQSVLVFDDPISSFDYNYVANYCTRVRDFALKHPSRQIIILTHNWECFVQLQTTLNGSGLNGQLSVQVIENCAVVADYSEKISELKTDIEAILNASGEPGVAQKEEMAGKMRRLIESVVNTHVFNQQRHQYKQKTVPVSTFHKFTKITPLLSTEATTLGDLFSKLSISEHDDPRNAYVHTDKAMFRTRYDAILDVESAVMSRK